MKRLDLFRGTRNQLEQNIQRYSWRLTKRDDKIIEPSEHPGTLAEAIDDALSGTPLHALLTTQCPFSIPRSCYLEHGLIVAGTGSGKTQLLQTLILDFLQNDPPGMFVIDSQGSMLKTIMRAVPETIAHRV